MSANPAKVITLRQDKVLGINLYGDDDRKKTQAQLLVEITSMSCQLFHDHDEETYAQIAIDTHQEIWKIQSSGFKRWLNNQFYMLTNKGANSGTVKDALATIEAQAMFDGKCIQVYLRVAQVNNAIYLDICNDAWSVIEITKLGWKILNSSPVPFIRSKGMKPLTTPKPNGDIELLKKHLNVEDRDFPLVVGWALMALQASNSAYPILILGGEQNTGKSETTTMLRLLVDPHTALIRTIPKEEDLVVMAFNNHVLALDNLSGIKPSYSDLLCCCSTGASQSKRRLYCNTEEVLVNLKRPLILNGIDDLAKRSDLASRSIFINLPSMTSHKRKSKQELWHNFNQDLPLIFAALLDGLSRAINDLPTTKIEKLPRMADFALWITAAERAYNWNGKFMHSYQSNIDNLISSTIESSPFAYAVKRFMDCTTEWTGDASKLLEILEEGYIDDRVKSRSDWIRTPKKVIENLRRHSPALRSLGIETGVKRHSSGNVITIERMDNFHDINKL